MILSIIMISIPERAERFNALKKKVSKQITKIHEYHPTLGSVEIVPVISPKFADGGGSIGYKRQLGLLAAKGEYVCWLDDDDDISPDYVETLVRLCNKGADVCTFNNVSKFDNFWMVVKMHFKTKHDQQAKPGIINRRPYHVCAFRRGVLDGVVFPDTNWDEDTGFIGQALKNCKTFAHSDAILHEYRRLEKSYSENNEEVRSIVR
jgi:glycosyltransferase involved in cell wall biosynthesis